MTCRYCGGPIPADRAALATVCPVRYCSKRCKRREKQARKGVRAAVAERAARQALAVTAPRRERNLVTGERQRARGPIERSVTHAKGALEREAEQVEQLRGMLAAPACACRQPLPDEDGDCVVCGRGVRR